MSRKIRELAQWQVGQGRSFWVVLPEFREKYGCNDLELIPIDDSSVNACSPAPAKITKFTKVDFNLFYEIFTDFSAFVSGAN